MTTRFVTGVVVAVAVGGAWGSMIQGQTPTSVADGVYTADQAKRGQAVYMDACSKCHLDDLSGGKDSPPLTGAEFLGGWKGKSLGELFDEVRMTMPFDSPGKLTPEQYADVIAFILSSNKFPAGAAELAHDVEPLQPIKIDAPKP